MKQPPDWAIEIAQKIYLTDDDTPALDLMAPPWGLDADTAIGVYNALMWMHQKDMISEAIEEIDQLKFD